MNINLSPYMGLLLATLFFCSAKSYANHSNEMKELIVTKINASGIKASELSTKLSECNVAYQPLDIVNWESYPYRPEVSFRIAYTDEAILLNYKVKEASVRAHYGEDNGRVWTDSCVEFFISPAGDDVYYNLECNCIGTILLGGGAIGDRRHASQEIMDKIERWSSLGNETFGERVGEVGWEVSLVIPYETFFRHEIASLQGETVRANFYKCGDELATPHFVSWSPILLEKPNFHCPEFFGRLRF